MLKKNVCCEKDGVGVGCTPLPPADATCLFKADDAALIDVKLCLDINYGLYLFLVPYWKLPPSY